MSAPRLLLLRPGARERRGAAVIAAEVGADVILDDAGYAGLYDTLDPDAPPRTWPDARDVVDDLVRRYRGRIDGVASAEGYPGGCLASAVAQRLGLFGAPPGVVLSFEHKVLSRRLQARHVPDAVPPFAPVTSVEPPLPLPLFLKPAKSCFSMNARKIDAPAAFDRWRHGALPDPLIAPLRQLLQGYDLLDDDAPVHGMIAEGLLSGAQLSLEGYVQGGDVVVLGVLDAHMIPGTRSFRAFTYPSRQPPTVLACARDIATRLMAGAGYDHALFNLELMVAPDGRVWIIEVNPKVASQFCDLFGLVDGTDGYAILARVALGLPVAITPGAGGHAAAGSFPLRRRRDAVVTAVPSPADLAAVAARWPGARIDVDVGVGDRLSAGMQDTESFRYAVINAGASDFAALERTAAEIAAALPFRFQETACPA